MKQAPGLLTLCLPVLLLLPKPAVAGESEPFATDAHWWCHTATTDNPIYVTVVWDGDFAPDEVPNGFGQYVLSKHGYKGQVYCSRATRNLSTMATIQAGHQLQMDTWKKSGLKVVETGWWFDPATVTLAYQCNGVVNTMNGTQMVYSAYYTKVQRIPPSSVARLFKDWDAWLNAQNPGKYINAKGCNLLPADPAKAQAMTTAQLDQWKSFNAKITQVDWTWPGSKP